MFLLRDGLLALIFRASFMVLKEVLVLSPQYGKIVNSDIMTRDVMMVIYGRWGLEMFLQPLFQISS